MLHCYRLAELLHSIFYHSEIFVLSAVSNSAVGFHLARTYYFDSKCTSHVGRESQINGGVVTGFQFATLFVGIGLECEPMFLIIHKSVKGLH